MHSLTNIQDWTDITVARASIFTYNWQTSYPALKAFLFHKNDLLCVSQESEATHLRFYMGLDDQTADMLVVGVDQQGKDIIEVDPINSQVYNFALPCPAVCDDGNSPLLHTSTSNLAELTSRRSLRQSQTQSCEERLFQISSQDAFQRTKAWQDIYPLKSVLFPLTDLYQILSEYAAETLRVYFGKSETQDFHLILIGVDGQGNDIIRPNLYSNRINACSTSQTASCDTDSYLYHP